VPLSLARKFFFFKSVQLLFQFWFTYLSYYFQPVPKTFQHIKILNGLSHGQFLLHEFQQSLFHIVLPPQGGTRWRSWLRHCTTSRKVAGSIPDGAIGVFHWHNPSGCTMTLGSTQPLIRNEYRGYLVGDKGGRCIVLTTLPPLCADCLEI
jgi:hypothetical protein